MSSNNRNKQYLIDMILKRRGHKDPQDPELEEEREELRKMISTRSQYTKPRTQRRGREYTPKLPGASVRF